MPTVDGVYLTDDEYREAIGEYGDLASQYRDEVNAGQRDKLDLDQAVMIDRDRASWEQRLREEAETAGVTYDPSDLEGVIRQVSYARNAGRDPADFIQHQIGNYAQRGAQTPGGGEAGGDPPMRLGDARGPGGGPPPIRPYGQTFAAPTLADVRASPGFQFRLGEALQAIERSGLAKGTYFTGQTARALQGRAADLAADEYHNLFGQQLAGYETNRYTHFRNEDGRYGSQRTNRMDDVGIADANRRFDFDVMDRNRNFGRALTTDQWGRGTDVWNMDRTDTNDEWDRYYRGKALERPPYPSG